MRRLCIILGDQLDRDSDLFDGYDPLHDHLWMAEVTQESTHVWSHKQRITLFLSGMRHFAAELQAKGWPLTYLRLDAHDFRSLGEALAASLQTRLPDEVRVVLPGDYRVRRQIVETCAKFGIPLTELADRHFLSTPQSFADWAVGRKQLRMEYWYRHLREQYRVLLDASGKPLGGQWNYDTENRKAFSTQGPQTVPSTPHFIADTITQQVIDLVNTRFADHPGKLEAFNWPTTPAQAQQLLERFLTQALPQFGNYQDALWQDQPFLYHSLLSCALNLKLLHPLDVIRQAEKSYLDGSSPLAAVEGFIRQILGWREYVRGLYWLYMPDWHGWNALDAQHDLPAFYWTGETDMNCLRQAIGQTLHYGYAHHIQRLMVTGLFAQLYGVQPMKVHAWYLAVYVGAVEWVELPNTLGMSQYADGGRMASKPYVASGKYIQKMSNYCQHCRYDPAHFSGSTACPFTTLFWDFLDKHETRFDNHPRMGFMVANLRRMPKESRSAIRQQANQLRAKLAGRDQ